MGTYKKLLPALLTLVMVSACGSPVTFEQPKADVKTTTQNGDGPDIVNLAKASSASSQKIFVADYGGKKGGTLSVKLNLPMPTFETKASTDGQLKKTSADIQSIKIGLCTDSTMPFSTAIEGQTFFTLNKTGTGPYQVDFQNVPVGGPYHAVVYAMDGSGGTGNDLIKPDNGGSPYLSTDAGIQAAVSSDTVTVNSNLSLSPAGEVLDVTINLLDGVGANVQTDIGINDGSDPGSFGAI